MATEVAQGFLEAAKVGEINFTTLLICIYRADQSALILYQALNILEKAYKDKKPEEAINGITGIISFILQLKSSITTCENIDETSMNWGSFNTILDVVESPEKHM